MGPGPDGTLTHLMCRLDTKEAPRLLDVIDVPCLKHKPLAFQPENWLIDRGVVLEAGAEAGERWRVARV